MSLNALIRSISCQQGDTWKRSSWRCVRRRCQRRVCGLQQSYIPVPPSLPGHGSARTSPRHRVHPHSATRRKAPRARPSAPCPHTDCPAHLKWKGQCVHAHLTLRQLVPPIGPSAQAKFHVRWGWRQPPILEHEHDRHARKGLLHSENRGLNKRISESEASQPPARPAAAPCRRHHGIRRPRGRSNPRRVGGVHVFRWLDGVQRLDDLHHLEGKGGGRAAPRRHANKLWAVAVPYGDSGNWRSHRVSELSRSGEIPNSAAAEVVLRGGRAAAVSADEALAQPLCRRGDRPAHARRPRDGPCYRPTVERMRISISPPRLLLQAAAHGHLPARPGDVAASTRRWANIAPFRTLRLR